MIFFLFILSKPLYEFFLLLFFLLDKEKLKKVRVRKNLLIFLIFLIIFYFRFINLQKTGSSLGLYNPNVQKIIIFENPLRMIDVFKRTYFNSFEFYIKSMIGILGWLDFNLDFFVYLSFFIVFGVFLGIYINKVEVKFKEIIIYFLIIFLNFLYILLGEFLYWSEPGADNIVGVQGRYLIIFIPYFFIILLFLIKKYLFYIFAILLIFFCYLNFKVTFDRYFDYSVYAVPTTNLNRLKKFISIEPKKTKVFKIEKGNFKSCYGVYLKFKNKDFKEPVKVEVYDQDKKNYRIIYFPPSRVNMKESVSISFYKTKFKLPVYIKVYNQYSNKPVMLVDGAALSCVF